MTDDIEREAETTQGCAHLHVTGKWAVEPNHAAVPGAGSFVYRCDDCGQPWTGGVYTLSARELQAGQAAVDEIDGRMREGRQLLRRMVKYVREDCAVTPGTTRLARLTDSVDDYLRRTHRASDVLRGVAEAKPEPQQPSTRELIATVRGNRCACVSDPDDSGDSARAFEDALTELEKRIGGE